MITFLQVKTWKKSRFYNNLLKPMKRAAESHLRRWKTDPKRKPLILQGARQVGKTWLLRHFGQSQFENTVYINFEEEPEVVKFFSSTRDPKVLIQKLSIFSSQKIAPLKTLVIFDEIQCAPEALQSLKYFQEKMPELHLAAAGSLLGVTMAGARPFPVGKVNFLRLDPMSFEEFLSAKREESLLELLREHPTEKPIDEPFHKKFLDYLKIYLLVGGMPEVVAEYIQSQDFSSCRKSQDEILKSYLLDFSKYASPAETLKISKVWSSIPAQLAKENKKFTFSQLANSARGREYEHAIQWLSGAGLIHVAHEITKPTVPLKSYEREGFFKLYCFDSGLLGAMAKLPARLILEEERLLEEFKGSLAENFVAQELNVLSISPLFYWTHRSKAEVDFILESNGTIIPVEVKSGKNTHKNGLKNYVEKFAPKSTVRFSTLNFLRNGILQNIPLYAVSKITDIFG